VVGLWSVVSVHKVVLTLDHLPSLSFLSLYLFQSWEAQLLCPHPGNWEKYWTELGAVAVGAHCEGFLVGVWSPQGLVSCSWDTMPACHGPECFAKEIEWRKRLWRTVLQLIYWCANGSFGFGPLSQLKVQWASLSTGFWIQWSLAVKIYHPNPEMFVWGRC